MVDLIYDEIKIQKEILEHFPNAIFEDASDDVHPDRFQVNINLTNEDEWYKFLVTSGLATVSLGFQLRFLDTNNKEFLEKVKGWVESNKA